MSSALILLDFIREIVHPDGKLAGKGYAAKVSRLDVIPRVNEATRLARAAGIPVIWVRVGFSPDYQELPPRSPLFAGAPKSGALQLGTEATELHPDLVRESNDEDLVKHRISAFAGTMLAELLRTRRITEVILGGVATDLAVSSTARSAHDEGFAVTIAENLCAAASEAEHDAAMRSLAKIARVASSEEILRGTPGGG